VKLRSLSRWVIGVPLLLIMVVFALSNRQLVSLEFFPLGRLPFELPLSVAILVATAVGFFLGGLRVRIAELRHRRAARRAEHEVRLMEAKHEELKARSARVGGTEVASHG
jgi:lipopolysaccharide assembly protein A